MNFADEVRPFDLPPTREGGFVAKDLEMAVKGAKSDGEGAPDRGSLEKLTNGEPYERAHVEEIPRRADTARTQLVEALSG